MNKILSVGIYIGVFIIFRNKERKRMRDAVTDYFIFLIIGCIISFIAKFLGEQSI